MGIADRDWYRKDHEKRSRGAFAYRPPTRVKSVSPSTIVLIDVGAIAIFVAGIKAHAWWKDRELAQAWARASQHVLRAGERAQSRPGTLHAAAGCGLIRAF